MYIIFASFESEDFLFKTFIDKISAENFINSECSGAEEIQVFQGHPLKIENISKPNYKIDEFIRL